LWQESSLTAALYAGCKGIDTIIIERNGVGGQTGVTESIENYPGFAQGIKGVDLADAIRAQAEDSGVEIRPAQTISSIMVSEEASDGIHKLVTTESGYEYCANAVLLGGGSRYRRPNVPGERDLISAGIHFCATRNGPFYKGQT